jgi:hypothetical protein
VPEEELTKNENEGVELQETHLGAQHNHDCKQRCIQRQTPTFVFSSFEV